MNELERNKLVLLVIRWANLIVLFLFVACPMCSLRFLGAEIGTGTMFDLSTAFNGEMEMSKTISVVATLAILAVLIGCACAFVCKRYWIGSISSVVAAVLLVVLRIQVPSMSEFGGGVRFTLVWYGALLLLVLAATTYKWLPLVINVEPEATSRERLSSQNRKSTSQESTEKPESERWNYEPQEASEVQGSVIPETELRFCRHCGNPIKPDMRFCSKCGKQL